MKGKIFTAQEVQSILDGSKIMFREVVTVQPPKDLPSDYIVFQPYKEHEHIWAIQSRGIGVKEYEKRTPFSRADGIEYWRELAPRQVGQEIFVKESFFIDSFNEMMFKATFHYCSKRFNRLKDLYHDKTSAWKPAQHMKQHQSRITLRIKEIRVERLQSISVVDARDEGCPLEEAPYKKEDFNKVEPNQSEINPFLKNFIRNWDTTHRKQEQKWEVNPFVWVIEFDINNK